MELHREQIFVFVVCGDREHIDTLHFSLKALKKFSKKRVIVVTDSLRNEINIAHSEVIDVTTPEQYNHHQASIYLKTGLNKFIPKGNLYCYLDTDVVAVDTKVNSIFNEYVSPITFCTDQGNLASFSPYSYHCNCLEYFVESNKKLSRAIKTFDDYYIKELDCSLKLNDNLILAHNFNKDTVSILKYIDDCIVDISKEEKKLKRKKLLYSWHKFKYFLPTSFYFLTSSFKMNKKSGRWYDKNNLYLRYEKLDMFMFINEQIGFYWDRKRQVWFSDTGKLISFLACDHLCKAIYSKFKTDISNPYWQHWNGGVFLFDDSSAHFLEQWHTSTLDIFNDENWRTRDQGTLIATVWKFNLQNHPTLPLVYNLIADYHNKSIEYQNQLTFFVGDGKKLIKPHFIHVYHHWGDKDWTLWSDLVKHIEVI